jgi:hypothetical protein
MNGESWTDAIAIITFRERRSGNEAGFRRRRFVRKMTAPNDVVHSGAGSSWAKRLTLTISKLRTFPNFKSSLSAVTR